MQGHDRAYPSIFSSLFFRCKLCKCQRRSPESHKVQMWFKHNTGWSFLCKRREGREQKPMNREVDGVTLVQSCPLSVHPPCPRETNSWVPDTCRLPHECSALGLIFYAGLSDCPQPSGERWDKKNSPHPLMTACLLPTHLGPFACKRRTSFPIRPGSGV